MKRKVELKLEELEVDSFETTPRQAERQGTVIAHHELAGGYTHAPYESCPPLCYSCPPYCEATLCRQDGCDTENESCGGSCDHCPDQVDLEEVNREAP